jgi:hypothetical protein
MKDYTIFIDGWVESPGSAPAYQIAIAPFSRSVSAMATTYYETKEALETDLRTYLGFTDAGIERYFAQSELRQALVHPLSDEDAAHFGWN